MRRHCIMLRLFRFVRRLARAATLMLLPVAAACDQPGQPSSAQHDASSADTLQATIVTAPVSGDSDDPAFWIDPVDPAQSRILGTDKGDSAGGIYLFTLDGQIDTLRTRRPLRRPNNVDVIQGVRLGGRVVDLAVATERGSRRLRVFQLPSMTPIDRGGIPVFGEDTTRAPMGIALYHRPRDGAVFAIVGGKSGPSEGYLWQYRLHLDSEGYITAERVRAFGRYSGAKEIESIAVDQPLGYVYYSDETVGIRKYHADPDHPDAARELALFATTGFVQDHEGLAIYPTSDSTGYLLASDQQGQRLQLFPREGIAGAPHEHPVLAVIPVSAQETDGLDVTAVPQPPRFPRGLLVMMSTDRTFHLFDWRDVEIRLPERYRTVTK